MAHSIQVIGNRAEVINDSDLLVLLGFMFVELKKDPKRYGLLVDISRKWQEITANYGPGMVDLHLEDVVASNQATKEMTQLLSLVKRTLIDAGNVIPTPLIDGPDMIFGEYKTSRLISAIEQIERLISQS